MSKKNNKLERDFYHDIRDKFHAWIKQNKPENVKLLDAFITALLDETLFYHVLDSENYAEFTKRVMSRCQLVIDYIEELEDEAQEEQQQAEALAEIPTQLMTAQ